MPARQRYHRRCLLEIDPLEALKAVREVTFVLYRISALFTMTTQSPTFVVPENIRPIASLPNSRYSQYVTSSCKGPSGHPPVPDRLEDQFEELPEVLSLLLHRKCAVPSFALV